MNGNELYLLVYFSIVLYFVVLGCLMLLQRENPICTRGEQETKRRMARSVGGFMLVWALQCLIYMLPILRYGYAASGGVFDTCFLLTVMLNTPAVYVVMQATLQKRVDLLRWIGIIGMPFLVLAACHLIMPRELTGRLPVYIAAVLVVADMAFLFFRYISDYRVYIRRMLSEYSDITGHEIAWVWSCYFGFVLQALLYLVCQFCWSTVVEYAYMGFSVVNATYLCYCTCRQKPLDADVVEATVADDVVNDEKTDAEEQDKNKEEEKAYYSIIEQKLETLCEHKYLYLEPDLTRESLCMRLSIGRTYLSLYLRSRGLTFYQYINSLRVAYAYKLMQEDPDMPVRDVCELSGFRSQTTFRKAFQEVMGCLPSEVKNDNRKPL